MSEAEPAQDIPFEEPAPDPTPEEEEAAEEEEAQPEEPAEDPTPQPEPPQDEDRAKLAASLSTRYETYKKSMIDKLGDEAPDWMVCPLCTSSMAPGFVNVRDFGNVPPEIQANVNTYFGHAREQDYEQDPDTRTCPTCLGKLVLKTGAIAGEHITHKCGTCNGYGYVPPPAGTANGHTVSGSPEESVRVALGDFEQPERDNWGEPRILPDGSPNANYGKQPQFKQVHPTYGVTANLSPDELVTG